MTVLHVDNADISHTLRQTKLAMMRLANTLLAACCFAAVAHAEVDFTRDIRPILAEKCYACHGPDDAVREAGLRFDRREVAVSELPSGAVAIVPRQPLKSELIRRIFSEDAEERMPPAAFGKQLTPEERQRLQQWISDGAPYDVHWAFVRPAQPNLPESAFPEWQQNEIDAFVAARMREAGLAPSAIADRTTLIRRLSLDLRGLPPTLAEVDAFLVDDSPDAWERLVDRFLDSDHFGEKLALDWLDLARYGDTNGYHNDSHRDVWLYRDWVIHAFNTNMPYDQFVREQVAGDLHPNATEHQIIASGFNRNAPFNEEGGADPDEFYVSYAVDRANTTGQALLGLTFGCAQCHSHKYDPISQKEYYEFFAFFNSVEGEIGGGGENGHHNQPVPPTFAATSPLAAKRIMKLQSEIADLDQQLRRKTTKVISDSTTLREAVTTWVKRHRSGKLRHELPAAESLVLRLDATDMNADGVPDLNQHEDEERVVAQWKDGSKDGLTAIATGRPRWVRDGFLNRQPAVVVDGKQDYLRTPTGGERLRGDFTIAVAVVFADQRSHQMLVMWGDEALGKRRSVWRTAGNDPRFSFNGYSADVVGQKALPAEEGFVGLLTKEDLQIYLELNGDPAGEGAPSLTDYVNEAITIGANNAGNERTAARIGEILIYNRVLSAAERAAAGRYLSSKFGVESSYAALPREIAEIMAADEANWSHSQWTTLLEYFLLKVDGSAAPQLRGDFEQIAALRNERSTLIKPQATTMVMKAMATRKPAYILARGDFQQPGERVAPNVPAILNRLPEDQLQNRLDLAQWLTDPDHPLVSRVRVNHLWKMLMGTGIVRTSGDFGTQGELPSHPSLLDWLATRFSASGWDTKALIKDIVMSSTYRQQSSIDIKNSRAASIDPNNRLLSRAPRFRLAAEEIRDMSLATSGMLNRTVGGPSVRPFQPPNYFSANSGKQWAVDSGEKARRRGIYTYLQRTAPFPAHLIFDAPSRQICTARRSRTNTPLQALVTMNDPLMVQAAGALAKATLSADAKTDRERVAFLFRSVLSRRPSEAEQDVLLQTYHEQREVYDAVPEMAGQLIKSAAIQDEKQAKESLAAWTNVASIVLNLDEAITRE